MNTDNWPASKQVAYHRNALEAEIRKAAAQVEAAYRANYPQAGSLRVFSDIKVYRVRPKGFSNIPSDVVHMFLTSALYLSQTNDAILAGLSHKWAPFPITKNIMAKPFTKTQAKRISAILAASGMDVDLVRYNTLTSIKRALRSRVKSYDANHTYSPFISFHDGYVVVNDASFPVTITTTGYRRVRVGRNWLRCDVLEAMLSK